ncbi:MAG: DUF1700 domain-containing protein [Clostridia bacterium]|nr:DUF1700 domain-containing protein [Clostridia bacterium]
MTKYEWESELKKNIHRLPVDEISRIMEYYDELFADKIERGYNECEIIGQFGNPVDVADKILADYEGATAQAPQTPAPAMHAPINTAAEPIQKGQETPVLTPAPAPAAAAPSPAKQSGGLRSERAVILAVVTVFTGFLPIILFGTVWIVAAALVVSGAACALGGVAGSILTVITVFRETLGVGLAQIGMCLAVAGMGVVLTTACVAGMRLLAKGTAWIFRAAKRWLYPVQKSEVKA